MLTYKICERFLKSPNGSFFVQKINFFNFDTGFDKFFLFDMIILARSIECLLNNAERGRIMRVGMLKKVDNLGRITIPKEYREFYRLNEKDVVCLIDTDKGILITNPKIKVVEVNDEEK